MSIIDQEATIKLAIGIVARGLIWVGAAAATQFGIESFSEDTATGLAGFLVALLAAAISFFWSKTKDKKLADS